MREYNPIYKYGMSERRKKVKKKALYKKWMSMLLAGVVTTTGFMGGDGNTSGSRNNKLGWR